MTARVKICGITDEAALDAAASAGADYIGLVFYEKSPRNLELDRALALRRRARDWPGLRVVALLVSPSDEQIARVVDGIDPDLLQLHGDESVERVAEIRARWGRPIIKAVSVSTIEDVIRGDDYLHPGRVADVLLFDARPASNSVLPGGNGLTFDWNVLEPVIGRQAFALAGGLDAQNVETAIRLTGADIVDVSSGVERAPGVKDPELIRRFLRNAKAAKQDGVYEGRPHGAGFDETA